MDPQWNSCWVHTGACGAISLFMSLSGTLHSPPKCVHLWMELKDLFEELGQEAQFGAGGSGHGVQAQVRADFKAAVRHLRQPRAFRRLYAAGIDCLEFHGMEELCVAFACEVFSTVACAGRAVVVRSRCTDWARSRELPEKLQVLHRGGFDAAIIDEASQLVEAETNIVIQVSCCNAAGMRRLPVLLKLALLEARLDAPGPAVC